MIALSVNMVILVYFSIGEDVFEKKTVAILEARFAVLGVAPATFGVFCGAADRDCGRYEHMNCGRACDGPVTSRFLLH